MPLAKVSETQHHEQNAGTNLGEVDGRRRQMR